MLSVARQPQLREMGWKLLLQVTQGVGLRVKPLEIGV